MWGKNGNGNVAASVTGACGMGMDRNSRIRRPAGRITAFVAGSPEQKDSRHQIQPVLIHPNTDFSHFTLVATYVMMPATRFMTIWAVALI